MSIPTNLIQAFDLIEVMRELGYGVELINSCDDELPQKWSCKFADCSCEDNYVWAGADTPEEAIHLAAQKVQKRVAQQ